MKTNMQDKYSVQKANLVRKKDVKVQASKLLSLTMLAICLCVKQNKTKDKHKFKCNATN